MTRTRAALALQPLEDRLAPATFTATSVLGTLVVTQTSAAVGEIQIIDDPVAGTVTANDPTDGIAASVFPTTGRPNLVVRLQPADTTLATYSIVSARAGNVSLSVQNTTPRQLNLKGGAPIGGNLTVTGGNGGLHVTESGPALHVTKNATFRSGGGPDTLDLSLVSGTLVGGTLSVIRFNEIHTGPGDSVGRLSFNAAGEATHNHVNLDGILVNGSLTYVGGTRTESIFLGTGVMSNTQVLGDIRVNFGTQLESDISSFVVADDPGNLIGGRISVTGSPSGEERVQLDGTVAGAVTLNLGGGTNRVSLLGGFNGPTFRYTGGSGLDILSYTPTAGSFVARITARLGDGADEVTLGTPTVNPSFAFIDFGAGTDTFSGTINFSCQFLNLA